MTSSKPGTAISEIEVLNISIHGFWIYVKDREYFLSYEDYGWFAKAKVSEICNVELLHDSHLYWPELDIDLHVNILENPDKYPLIFKE